MFNGNLIIKSFWHGPPLSQIEQLCINSFLANGHEFHLYTYNTNLGIPKGCVIKDANEIVDEAEVFLDSRKIIASFSDYFRVKLLYTKGGWWVDMDIICLKPFTTQNDYCFSSEYCYGKTHPNIGCIKVPKKSDIMADYFRVMDAYLSEKQEVKWGAFGPSLMKELLTYYDSEDYIANPEDYIQPPIITGPQKDLLFGNLFIPRNELKIQTELTGYSIHLYNELWRLYKIDKSQPFPERSVLEYLNLKYS